MPVSQKGFQVVYVLGTLPAQGLQQAQSLLDRQENQRGMNNRSKWDEGDSISKGLEQPRSDLDAQACFANAASAAKRQQAYLFPLEQRANRRDFAFAPYQGCELRRQILHCSCRKIACSMYHMLS